jgi:hypothetical protein
MFGKRNADSTPGGSVSLHDRVQTSLARGFKGSVPDYSLGLSEADLLIQQGPRVAVVEVKTGDPDLPLPSSTSSQMLLLKKRVHDQFLGQDVQEVLPVLVTNYKVSAEEQKGLEEQGIKVVRIDHAFSSRGDSASFARQVATLTGLQADAV